MFNASFLGIWLAYGVGTLAMGFVSHRVLFKRLYAKLAIYARLDDPIVPLGLAAMLIEGAVLAYLYPFISSGEDPESTPAHHEGRTRNRSGRQVPASLPLRLEFDLCRS
jgi:hypothetical protein